MHHGLKFCYVCDMNFSFYVMSYKLWGFPCIVIHTRGPAMMTVHCPVLGAQSARLHAQNHPPDPAAVCPGYSTPLSSVSDKYNLKYLFIIWVIQSLYSHAMIYYM